MITLIGSVTTCQLFAGSSESSKLLDLNRLPEFLGGNHEDGFQDIWGPNGSTTMSLGCFWWLINIHLGHLVYHEGMTCHMEPYLPNRFAHQFDYSHLYVENPNLNLSFQGNLFDGARAWYDFCIGDTGVQFFLPHKTPTSYLSQGFYTWYHATNVIIDFRINHDCLKEIESFYSKKRGAKRTRVKGIDEFLSLNYDDEVEDEGGAARIREEAIVREGVEAGGKRRGSY